MEEKHFYSANSTVYMHVAIVAGYSVKTTTNMKCATCN